MLPKSTLETKLNADKKAAEEAAQNPFNFLGGLFSPLFSNFGANLSNLAQGFQPFLEKAGQAMYNICKNFAEGKIAIEPLDIFKALSDLLKAFCNFAAECFLKPAESAGAGTPTSGRTGTPAMTGTKAMGTGLSSHAPASFDSSTPLTASTASADKPHSPADRKLSVDMAEARARAAAAKRRGRGKLGTKFKAATPAPRAKVSSGLGFSAASKAAGLDARDSTLHKAPSVHETPRVHETPKVDDERPDAHSRPIRFV